MVIKVGGNELDDPNFVTGLAQLAAHKRQELFDVVVVHGGGRFIEELQSRLELPVHKVAGLRATCAESMQAVRMALIGIIGQDLCLAFQKKGIAAAALSACSGLEGPCLLGRRISPSDPNCPHDDQGHPVDLGFVGRIQRVDTSLFRLLLEAGCVPVVAPPAIGNSEDGTTLWLNVNADDAAAALAAALEAQELTFLTNVAGVLKDGDPIKSIAAASIEGMIDSQVVSGGMIPKLRAAAKAVEGGVPMVRLGSLASLQSGGHTSITT
jgi:acetylglutamate kinase